MLLKRDYSHEFIDFILRYKHVSNNIIFLEYNNLLGRINSALNKFKV